ncbi:hypothetical protein BDW59DRAFT_106489 [Aspergillus cavernicola]|uniref:LYC1 C-terminal domain-containing protein n=1 Tax=Aspergillus cavernicola TaxID=176166 RepID=A0ABR4IXX7_9EURO
MQDLTVPTMFASLQDLPLSTSSDLRLAESSKSEQMHIWNLKAREPYTPEAYAAIEEHCANQLITNNGQMIKWVLVHGHSGTEDANRVVLASCHSIQRPALVARLGDDGESKLEPVVCHTIRGVYCPEEFRRRGYATRLINEVQKVLENRVLEHDDAKAQFTCCYSDIGNSIYRKGGWKAFAATHIDLPLLAEMESRVPPSNIELLQAADVDKLCAQDVDLMSRALSRPFQPHEKPIRVALLPNYPSIQWHHACEEAASRHILGRVPTTKGALASIQHGKIWCTWHHTFPGANQIELHILRFVVDVNDSHDEQLLSAIGAVLQAARIEAAEWKVNRIVIKSPDPLVVSAARRTFSKIQVEERDIYGVPFLLWHGPPQEVEDIEWTFNEEYGDF